MATTPALGAPGPYMVCAVCNTPLDRFSLVNDDLTEEDPDSVRYTHGAALADEDHPPVPVAGTPIDAALVCDFCHAPRPKYVFVPRRPIRVPAPDGTVRDYSSPWSACDDCVGPARKKDMTKLLNRAVNSPHGSLHDKPRHIRRALRPGLRQLYSAFFRSAPAGPYETKIKGESHTGKRGGRRGMS